MTGADYAILAILLVSTLISVMRGFVREAMSLVSWILATALAIYFAPYMTAFMTDWITIYSLRVAVAFILIFVATLVLASIVSFLVNQLLKKGGLRPVDRTLGVLFGLARGVVIVSVLVLLVNFTPFGEEPWLKEAVLAGHFQVIGDWMYQLLPAEMRSQVEAMI
jgi:membrane protein required for colicin V production